MSFEIGRNAEGQTYAKSVTYPRTGSVSKEERRSHLSIAVPLSIVFIAGLVTLTVGGHLPALLLICYAVMSLITFGAYGLDRIAARKNSGGQAREVTLQLMAFMCGWPGALLAQNLFGHKIGQHNFMTTFWVIVALNCFGLCWTQLRPILG